MRGAKAARPGGRRGPILEATLQAPPGVASRPRAAQSRSPVASSPSAPPGSSWPQRHAEPLRVTAILSLRLVVLSSSSSQRAALRTRRRRDVPQSAVEDLQRLRDVRLAVGERHIDLVDGLHESAAKAGLVEAADTVAIRGQRRTIVDDVTIGEDDVEHRRLSAHLRRKPMSARSVTKALAQRRADAVQALVSTRAAQLRERREPGGGGNGITVERSR